MSMWFGPARQIGFVVRDLDRALRCWTETLGVGPFFVTRNYTPDNYRYRGKPSPGPLMSFAFGNSGDLQVELIEQHDDRPSVYREFLDAGREGFHHVSAWLRRAEYDATLARLRAEGAVIGHEGGTDFRFAYVATDHAPGRSDV